MVRHKPPSQVRYEKAHPTISFRLDLETRQRLKNVLKGKSVADFVKEAMGEREREKGSLEDEYEKGYREGYNQARKVYGIYTDCAICGKRMMINEEKVKKEIEMSLRGMLYHTACIKEKKRI